MTVQDHIQDLHHDLAEATKAALGKEAIVVTVASMNDRAPGQWILHHPDLQKGVVADRLKLCARILVGEVTPDGREHSATAEQQRDFLADAMRKALKHLDKIDLDAYFAEATKETPHPWVAALMAMHDELRPALNVLGLDYHTGRQ